MSIIVHPPRPDSRASGPPPRAASSRCPQVVEPLQVGVRLQPLTVRPRRDAGHDLAVGHVLEHRGLGADHDPVADVQVAGRAGLARDTVTWCPSVVEPEMPTCATSRQSSPTCDVVGDLDEVVDLGAPPDPRLAERRAVDADVGARARRRPRPPRSRPAGPCGARRRPSRSRSRRNRSPLRRGGCSGRRPGSRARPRRAGGAGSPRPPPPCDRARSRRRSPSGCRSGSRRR